MRDNPWASGLRVCFSAESRLDFYRCQPFVPLYRKALELLEFQDRGLPSRTIVARLRSLGGNIIALATAECSFMVP